MQWTGWIEIQSGNRWNSSERERGNFAENGEPFARLPDENSRSKYLESRASEAVTWNIFLTGNDKRLPDSFQDRRLLLEKFYSNNRRNEPRLEFAAVLYRGNAMIQKSGIAAGAHARARGERLDKLNCCCPKAVSSLRSVTRHVSSRFSPFFFLLRGPILKWNRRYVICVQLGRARHKIDLTTRDRTAETWKSGGKRGKRRGTRIDEGARRRGLPLNWLELRVSSRKPRVRMGWNALEPGGRTLRMAIRIRCQCLFTSVRIRFSGILHRHQIPICS